MKRLLLLLLLLLFASVSVNAQIVTLEPGFKEALLDASPDNEIAKNLDGDFFKVDTNNDGDIQVSEALNVSYIEISSNDIYYMTGIDAFTNLIELHSDNAITSLIELNLNQNINLEILHLRGTWDLVNLYVSGCINLRSLFIDESLVLSNLDVSQNVNLLTLHLTETSPTFTSLDVTQNINLQTLHLFSTINMTSLDVTQNSNLETLIVSGASLNVLDVSQNTLLKNLNCSGNSLTNLDVSQNILLESINCAGNDNSPPGLMSLDFSQNINLQNINISNFYLENLNIKNGTSEEIILELNQYILNICADEDDIPYLFTLQFLYAEDSTITSYCDFIPGGHNNNITGEVLFDSDNDGCDTSDLPVLYNVRIDLGGAEQGSAYVNGSGNYNFFTQEGDFTLTPNIENEAWYTITPTSVDIQFLDNNDNLATQDFCITANGVHNDVEIVINPIIPARPGFDAYYQIVYNNKGNQVLSGDINFMFDDAVLDFVSASFNPDNQTVGSLTWNYSNLRPLESKSFLVILNVNSPMETPAVNIGDQLNFLATIYPISNDESPDDNEFSYKEEVTGSYDPNDITCLEGDIVSPEMIGEYLHYNIRFENTGTAAATFVVVTNEIDETQYDLNSLQILNASHEMTTRMVGNKIEFIFDNIDLQPEGRGNVVYKIKSLSSLVIGDAVSQDANIFFDYNFPIETNTATTTFETLSVDEFSLESSIKLYPNPTNGQLFINSTDNITDLVLYDIHGRKIQNFIVPKRNMLDISNVSKGVYFLEITSVNGKFLSKIIKD